MVRPLDTTAEAEAVQVDVFRRMGGVRRLQAGLRMSEEARQLAIDGVRHRHPSYSPEQLEDAGRLMMLGEDLFRRVWPDRALPIL